MSEAKILDATWSTTMSGEAIGIVIVDTGSDERKCYIGVGKGASMSEDAQFIAQHGTPLDAVHLLNFFKRNELIK